MDTNYLIVLVVIVGTFGQRTTQETCNEILRNEGGSQGCSNYDVCYPTASTYWYQITFWGGYLEIAWKESSILPCSKYYTDGDFLVLMNEPPVREDMDETVLSLEACIRNQNDLCKEKVAVYIRNCGGDLLVRFPWINVIRRKIYVCIDFIFSGGCNDPILEFTAEVVNGNVIELALGEQGWYNTFYEEKQYTFPSTEYTEMIFDACPKFDFHFLLQDPVPESINETPVKLTLCRVTRVSHVAGTYYNTDCNYVIYMRKCNGKLQFETTWASTNGTKLCLVHLNGVKVIPDIGHTTQDVNLDGITTKMYSPFLQFRCSFEMDAVALYKIKWYINNILYTEKGPSNSSEDLALTGDSINDMELGYMIKCGVIDMTVNESSELLSFNFFAGWKVSDKGVELIKGGSVIVDVELTIPIGCAYTDNEQAHCTEELSITDPSYVPDICQGGIRVINAVDTSKSYHEVQSLKQGTEWNRSKKYRFKLSTSDVNYDDPVAYDLQVRLTNGADSKVIETLHVHITDVTRHLNKLCYSHVDPHMRTADGRYYEQQREGDYMLLRNIAHQMEIQELARYCSPPRSSKRPPPVCACGIAIRFGGDLFMINRCSRANLLDFVQCRDGGILEVDRIDDYRYRVRAPTGTVIDITIHSRGKTMNIDVYMSPRDFGNIDGLCGYFDGNIANDFLLRHGSYSNGNTDYKFSDSWRLSDEENFFKNLNRVLEPWSNKQDGRTCSRPNSITKTKCKLGRRSKRGDSDVRRDFERLSLITSTRESVRSKRNAQGTVTADEVASLCNASIFGSPSVMELQDKLADEDLSEVVAQCVYDVTEGNDTVWVEAHVQALSNIVTTVVELNPVFAAKNTELLKKFLSQTCLNNCSDNGACSDTGHCLCNDPYRGPDCGTDLRIPPILNDIEGGGICDVATDNDCECFVIRTDNIFDGFVCSFSIYKVFFNGTRSQVGQLQQAGEYEDIFTGICCVTEELTKLPEDIPDPFVVMYELSISNDGVNYGETIPVYVYDTTCICQVLRNENIEVEIKAGYCFIDDMCITQGSPERGGDQCGVCDPYREPFRWYKGNCDDIRTGFTSAPLTGIIIGSLVGFGILTLIISVLLCKASKKHRVVRDVHSLIQVSPVNLDLRVQELHAKKTNSDIKAGATDTIDFGEYVAVKNTF